jgi:ABC-type transport system involved in cytochrome bd biosynthesis fused ATPase/permease subunit
VRLDAYRTQLGVVLQDTFLFDGTIRENVAFARPGATEEQMLAACRIARVDEFAEKVREEVRHHRRRARREALRRPAAARLDRARHSGRPAHPDPGRGHLEPGFGIGGAIQEGLAYLMKGRTTFVIAHRLSTIRRADQILVVEEGRIVERGTHESLYAAGGRYYDLYTRQHGIDANLFLAPGEGVPRSSSADVEEPQLPV